jgi:hypothetical protein
MDFPIFSSHFLFLTTKYAPLSPEIPSIYVLTLRDRYEMLVYVYPLRYIESINIASKLLTLRDESQRHQSWQSVTGCLNATF